MTTTQIGAYWLLICATWDHDPPGWLPDDDKLLARLTRMTLRNWLKIKPVVMCAFRKEEIADAKNVNSESTFWVQKRVCQEYGRSAQLHQSRVEGGRKTAQKRWGSPSNSSATSSPYSSAYSSATSSAVDNHIHNHIENPLNPPEGGPSADAHSLAPDDQLTGGSRSKRRINRSEFQPPTLQEFIEYGQSKGISEQDCREQHQIWDEGERNWRDGNGTPIKNWKQKLLTQKTIGNLPSDKRNRANPKHDSGLTCNQTRKPKTKLDL